MGRTRRLCGMAIASLFASVSEASAGNTNAVTCSQAADRAQVLRDQHKLLEARETLQTCALAACPAIIRKDCSQWLAEVNQSLPTVVISAKDASGTYLRDVKVSLDGKAFPTELDGRAQSIDPGPHVFVFEKSDGTRTTLDVPIREGEKNQSVSVVLSNAASSHLEGDDANATSPWKTVGFIAGGLGIVGLGVGTVFGLMASSAKGSADCDAQGYCNDGASLASARSYATVSTVGFIAGGVLLASGIGIVLFMPGKSSRTDGAGFRLRLGLSAGGLAFGSVW